MADISSYLKIRNCLISKEDPRMLILGSLNCHYMYAIASISTKTSFGSLATSTHDLEG